MYKNHDHSQCIKNALLQAEQICKTKDLRFTNIRRKIFEIIWTSHQPSKAYDILDQLKQDDKNATPPTVYRSLDFLIEHGFVHRIKGLNAYVGCPNPLKHRGCYFLICLDCKEIKECHDEKLNRSIKLTAGKHHFVPSNGMLEIEGYCAQCQK